MRFWLKTTRPNVGLWKNLPLGPLGLILGAMLLNSAILGGGDMAGLAVSASSEAVTVEAKSGPTTTTLLSDSSAYMAPDENGAKSNQAALVLADKSSLIASPSVTKLARRR